MTEAKAKAKEEVSEAPLAPVEKTSDNAALATTYVAIDGKDGNALLSVQVRGLPRED